MLGKKARNQALGSRERVRAPKTCRGLCWLVVGLSSCKKLHVDNPIRSPSDREGPTSVVPSLPTPREVCFHSPLVHSSSYPSPANLR
jgi:hypothetical protein